MARQWLAAFLAAVILPLAFASPAGAATTHIWMQNGFTATNAFAAGDSTQASYFFNRSGSYGTQDAANSGTGISNGYTTTPCRRYTSEAALVSDINGGVIPDATWPAGSCVEYDTEDWAATPAAEQQSPETYMPAFNQAAVNAGFNPADTPAKDLGNVDTTCPKSTHGGTNITWYEQCHIAQYAVTSALNSTTGWHGLVVVQNQTEENTSGSGSNYNTLYNDAKADAHGADASSAVLTEISQSQDTSGACPGTNCGKNSISAVESLGKAATAGVFLVDTNTDAQNSEGWEDTVAEALSTNGW